MTNVSLFVVLSLSLSRCLSCTGTPANDVPHRYQRLCGLLERHGRRDDLLYAMLGACDLPERLTVVAPARATDVHLRAYHDRDYVEVRTNCTRRGCVATEWECTSFVWLVSKGDLEARSWFLIRGCSLGARACTGCVVLGYGGVLGRGRRCMTAAAAALGKGRCLAGN